MQGFSHFPYRFSIVKLTAGSGMENKPDLEVKKENGAFSTYMENPETRVDAGLQRFSIVIFHVENPQNHDGN